MRMRRITIIGLFGYLLVLAIALYGIAFLWVVVVSLVTAMPDWFYNRTSESNRVSVIVHDLYSECGRVSPNPPIRPPSPGCTKYYPSRIDFIPYAASEHRYLKEIGGVIFEPYATDGTYRIGDADRKLHRAVFSAKAANGDVLYLSINRKPCLDKCATELSTGGKSVTSDGLIASLAVKVKYGQK